MKISIIGLGFVGDAMYQSFNQKNVSKKYIIYGYDKFRDSGIGDLKQCIDSNIVFLALPTPWNSVLEKYDYASIEETIKDLSDLNFNGCIIIKSTVEPKTTNILQQKYPHISFVHNPEFLTARTAFQDFHNQSHIVLGRNIDIIEKQEYKNLLNFYKDLYPNAEISECTSIESESMKLFCNSFYAVKVQFFNELYLLSQKLGSDYGTIVNLMLKNNWINPMHTNVPGPDGLLSYGGMCFPKDTTALLQVMKNNNSEHKVLEACVNERNMMRIGTKKMK
jgi:UDPglucose 6-dehydrogenase